ncbi:MAG: hypothetical protein JWQ08_2394, partial [Deinococcus sp.]|nr:hypothetical protein [Deinococcus sp.]
MNVFGVVVRSTSLALVLAACAGSPDPSPGNPPRIGTFTATPATLSAPGPVTLAWEVQGAASLEIDGGVGPVTPPDAGSKAVNLTATTTFTLTATNASGSTTARVTATLNSTPLTYEIDPSLRPSPDTTGDGRGGTLPLAASQDEQGVRSEFMADQVLIAPRDQAELDSFLTRTGGTVLEDDTIPAPPPELGITLTDEQRRASTYTVHLDPSRFSLATFEGDSVAVGLSGKVTLSSEAAARLLALSLSEVAAGRAVGLNYLDHQDSVLLKTEESPAGAGFTDAFATTRFQGSGSRSNVVGAWQWMRATGVTRRVRVAVLDGGFWVGAGGQPLSVAGIGSDLPTTPTQYDFVNNDYQVGDPNPGSCTGGSPCPWHGNSAAGAATGAVNNRAGAAGTGGLVADPMLFHIRTTKGQQKWALSVARAWGADVISMSFGGACNYTCRWEERILGYDKEIERARNAGIVLVASAGNSSQNVDEDYVHPCNYGGVICVGALNDDANTPQGYSNFGGSVDIWAPTNFPVMPDGANMTVHSYGGTSASAPFVAGIAAMMRAVNPALNSDAVRDLLRDTGWTDSSDAKVSHAVNALAALKRASNNGLPPDRLEPNSSAGQARSLGAGQYDDLNIHRSSESDFYRLTASGASRLTLRFTSPDPLGKLGFG